MFKKKAPKRSSKGVGITSGLMDDVAGYVEGGEVTDDRTERERLARQLLEQNRDENSDYQTFAEGERPQMYRPPATAPGMVPQPQPNPQQMQAMQMQRMAQMGMLPRFQEGGEVMAPSAWSRLRQGIGSAIGLRGRSGQPMFARGTEPEIYGSPMGSNMGSPGMDNPEFSLPKDNILARLYREPGYRPADGMDTPVNPAGLGFAMTDLPVPEGGGRSLFSNPLPDLSKIPGAVMGRPQFNAPEEPLPSKAPMRSESAETERARRAEEKKAPPLPKSRDQEGGGTRSPKADNLSDIKAEREAKAAAARQENIWLALMQAGLAIAGGKSSNAITNIGQGGQAGLASFVALEQQRRRDEDAAVRRDLAQREYQLQERRLAMQEPYYQAMTNRQAALPILAAQDAARRDQLARLRASEMAQKAWTDYQKNNQPELLKLKPEARKIKEDIFLKQKLDEYYKQQRLSLEPNVGMPQSRSSSESSPEE
jgi:hypothetical protein